MASVQFSTLPVVIYWVLSVIRRIVYCNILRDDGLSYGDYVEQLTFLLFLKMADEQGRPPYRKPSPIPAEFGWDTPIEISWDVLAGRYRHALRERRDAATTGVGSWK